MAKPLGAKHHGINFTKAGDVLARAVCNKKITQQEAHANARQLIAEAADGKFNTVEDTIQRVCKMVGIGRQFAGV